MKIKTELFVTAAISVLLLTLQTMGQGINPPSSVQADLKYLASDELQGRLAGSEGNVKAGEYILNQFKQIGLLPINGKYTQSFPIADKLTFGENNSLIMTKIVKRPGLPPEMWLNTKRNLKLGTQFMPVSVSANASANGEIAFVGYGITASELNYDDYSNIDVNGKIVIIISDSAEGIPLDKRFVKYATLRYKATNAKAHGATAVIFVKRLSDSANTFYPLNVQYLKSDLGIPAVQVNRTEIAQYFPKGKNLYPVELKLLETKQPQSFVLPNVSCEINVELKKQNSNIVNVLGMLKGSEKPDEYIVVGAHFDHIGHGELNPEHNGTPQIYNGADDNASGVTAMIELARRLSSNPPSRSVIFVAFNAEEMGLLGSKHFVNNPPVDLSKIITMINFDMVGRLRNNLIVFGTTSSKILNSIVSDVAAKDSISISKNKDAYTSSDQLSFVSKGIPSLFFFTGTHEEYDTPNDDWNTINFPGLLTVVKYAEDVIKAIDNSSERPDFVKSGGPHEGGKNEIKVSFGSIPDFEYTGDGLAVRGCKENSPCERCGMTSGDILISLNGKHVKDIVVFTQLLKEVNPGDVVEIIYLHNGKKITKNVKLDAK